MKRSIISPFLFAFWVLPTYAQEISTPIAKIIVINETSTAPKIDGNLDDEVWTNTPEVNEFIQSQPNPGEAATEQTEVKIIYDKKNIYLSAKMDISKGQKVFKNLTIRDVTNQNTDVFSVEFDTYHDLINSFVFMVTAAGVQIDGRRSEEVDFNWNAVWQSEVKHTTSGWQVEMRIPYSAIRFPDKKIQEWGIRFHRTHLKKGELTSWPFIDFTNNNIVRQFGTLKGIENIDSPLRLALIPYASGRIEHHTTNGTAVAASAGLDVKYGINDAFTLDMTLVPDFSQVAQDNQVLNLTPQEIQFDERRPFFTEGVELFDKTDLFYSRRVGGLPIGYNEIDNNLQGTEQVIENPETSQLINATKVTGRTTKGTGIGFFNAITKPTYAKIRDADGKNRKEMTDPLTNYGVFVFDQNLKGGSSLGFALTNVYRSGHYEDVSAGQISGSLFSKKGKYAVDFQGQAVHKTNDNRLHYSNFIGLRKDQGKFTCSFWRSAVGKEFDSNDLGFNQFINFQQFGYYGSYRAFEPKSKKMRYFHFNTFLKHERLLKPNIHTDFTFATNTSIQWSNFWRTTIELGIYTSSNDFYDTGVDKRFITKPGGQFAILILTSDQRKKLQLWTRLRYYNYNLKGGQYNGIAIRPTVIINDKLSLNWQIGYDISYNEIGTVRDPNSREVLYHDENIIVGKRNLETVEQELGVNILFTNKLGMSINCRHYWASVKQNTYHTLELDGSQTESNYSGKDSADLELHNSNFNAFTVNTPLTWQFSPGSELALVWQTNLFTNEKKASKHYFNNLSDLFNSPQSNSFSVRMTYYLDYHETKCKLSGGGC